MTMEKESTEYELQVRRTISTGNPTEDFSYWHKVTIGTYTEIIKERADPYWDGKETRVLELKKRIMTEEELA